MVGKLFISHLVTDDQENVSLFLGKKNGIDSLGLLRIVVLLEMDHINQSAVPLLMCSLLTP